MAAGVLEIEVGALRAVLADVTGVVEARNTIPVLSNVLLTVTPTSLTVMGTDLDVWVSRHATVETARGFEITVEATTFRRVVDKLPADARCVLTVEDATLSIVAGRSRFKLPTLPHEDFPQPTHASWSAEFEMSAFPLAAALDRVQHAMSSEETRYYLNGVFIHSLDAELRFAATDGGRLARFVVPVPDGAASIPDVIVSRKVVKLVDALLSKHEGSIDVRVSQNRIRFEIGETTIDAKLIEGTYPDYARVIPTSNPSKLSIEREALIAAIGRVITVAEGKAKVVKVEFARDLVTVSVTSPEKGQGSEELPGDWSGDPLTIGFNAKFLLELLAKLNGDTIEASFADAMSPTLWRDGDDSPALFVLMPMRL